MITLAYILICAIVAVLLVPVTCFIWCTLRDNQKARAWNRQRAKEAAPAVYLSFVLPDRMTVPSEAERAILEARAKRRKKVDDDILAIMRQIESQS